MHIFTVAFQMRLHEFDLIRTTADVERIFKECQTEADRLLKKYLEDIKTDPSVQHPSCILEIEIDELLNNFSG